MKILPNRCYVDTETTGLDPDVHEIWECALIVEGPKGPQEHHWFLPVDLGRADPFGLAVGQFYERYPDKRCYPEIPGKITPLDEFAYEFSMRTRGLHMIGAVISFDDKRLEKLLRWNKQLPGWHYHIFDVEAAAVGWCRGKGIDLEGALKDDGSSWDSTKLSRLVGVDPDDFLPKHTALSDARWARAMYNATVG